MKKLLLLTTLLFTTACQPQGVADGNQNINTNTATTTEVIDTSDWQTYRNEEYGFEFKYPGEWKITQDDFRENIKFEQEVGLRIPRLWHLQFDTGIVESDRKVPIYIFFDDCSRVGIGCMHNRNNPLAINNGLYVFRDESSSGRSWVIVRVEDLKKDKNLFSVLYTYDLDEGIGYEDYIGRETRKYLDELLLNSIKTIKPID